MERMFKVKRMLKLIYITLCVLLFYFILWIFTKFAEMGDGEKKRLAKWYFGGLGSAGAACCTHPLDLIKVHLQTQQGGNMGAAGQAVHIVRSEDVTHTSLISNYFASQEPRNPRSL